MRFSHRGLPASRVRRTCRSASALTSEEGRVRTATESPGKTVPPAKPKGGYQLIPAICLAMAWWAYLARLIRLVDLRVYFAAWEMRARRGRTPSPLPCCFTLRELQRLTGLSLRRLRASLRRLKAARLLTWADSAIGFPASPEAVPISDRDGFRHFLDQIPNHRRLVPVPRRILRLLAGGARPALIATILGHLFRCLYLKGGKCLAVGRVKASWIAETFGMSLRRIKEARQELIAMRWLIPLESKQWALNRWGALIRINLDWSRLDGTKPPTTASSSVESSNGEATDATEAAEPGPELAPPPPTSGTKPAPPDSNKEPLQGDKNQEPALGGSAGFFKVHPEEGIPEPGCARPGSATACQEPEASPAAAKARPFTAASARCSSSGKPDWRNINPEDLSDTGRLLDLYEQAVGLGLVKPSEHDRLRFVAAAEHARVIGTKNPCGLFVRLVRGGLLHFVTYDDEVAASVRLRRHLHGGVLDRRPEQRAAIPDRPELSPDARLVQAVRAAALKTGYRGDAFPLLRRQKPEWTRERWDRALAEL
jgi:hypothetical protein